MTPIRALVVDDEKPGRERVRRLLGRDARVELAGCCGVRRRGDRTRAPVRPRPRTRST